MQETRWVVKHTHKKATHFPRDVLPLQMCVGICVCACVSTYIYIKLAPLCMYAYIYIYIYTYIVEQVLSVSTDDGYTRDYGTYLNKCSFKSADSGVAVFDSSLHLF